MNMLSTNVPLLSHSVTRSLRPSHQNPTFVIEHRPATPILSIQDHTPNVFGFHMVMDLSFRCVDDLSSILDGCSGREDGNFRSRACTAVILAVTSFENLLRSLLTSSTPNDCRWARVHRPLTRIGRTRHTGSVYVCVCRVCVCVCVCRVMCGA